MLWIFALLSAAMLGLAAGAIWMVAILYLRQPASWLALPLGALLAWAICHGVRPAGASAAWLAALTTLLAALYVNILMAGVVIAGNMGMGLIDALRTAGAGMLWQLVRLSTTAADIGWIIAGATLAAMIAWYPARRRLTVR